MSKKQAGKVEEEKSPAQSIGSSLKELEKIAEWFENQEDVDVEKGIEKVKKGATLLKETRKKLSTIENEFENIKKGLA